MTKSTAQAILHLLDRALQLGLQTREGQYTFDTAINWLHDEIHRKEVSK